MQSLFRPHNEAHTIPALIQSLKEQTYPSSSFSVYVMADHCTDQTAKVAQQMGALTLLRQNATDKCKGAALKDAFTMIEATEQDYDAFVILDADNIVDDRFLEEINHALQQGEDAVQGYIDAKNPYSSWIAYAHSIWYWLSNRIIQNGYSRLGIGCKLGGTGFAITKKVLKQVPWEAMTLAEDGEYTLRLSLAGIKVTYLPKAVVYDEKPCRFSTSVHQRIRWTQGITHVHQNLVFPLLCKGKWNVYLRFWSDLLLPLTFFLFLIMDFFAILHLTKVASFPFVILWTRPLPFLFLNLYVLGMILVSLRGLILDKKLSLRLCCHLPGLFLFFLSWIPAGIIGIFRHNHKEWFHTEHTKG